MICVFVFFRKILLKKRISYKISDLLPLRIEPMTPCFKSLGSIENNWYNYPKIITPSPSCRRVRDRLYILLRRLDTSVKDDQLNLLMNMIRLLSQRRGLGQGLVRVGLLNLVLHKSEHGLSLTLCNKRLCYIRPPRVSFLLRQVSPSPRRSLPGRRSVTGCNLGKSYSGIKTVCVRRLSRAGCQ